MLIFGKTFLILLKWHQMILTICQKLPSNYFMDSLYDIGFEVFMAATMKNAVFSNVTLNIPEHGILLSLYNNLKNAVF
jgi:hypothetical protein